MREEKREKRKEQRGKKVERREKREEKREKREREKRKRNKGRHLRATASCLPCFCGTISSRDPCKISDGSLLACQKNHVEVI